MADMSGIWDGRYRRSAVLKWVGKSVATLETMLCRRSEVDPKGTQGEMKTRSERRRDEDTNEDKKVVRRDKKVVQRDKKGQEERRRVTKSRRVRRR